MHFELMLGFDAYMYLISILVQYPVPYLLFWKDVIWYF